MEVDTYGATYQFTRHVAIGDLELPLLTATFIGVFCIPCARYFFVHAVFRPVGNRLLPARPKNGTVQKSGSTTPAPSLLEKWEMACWSLLFYIVGTFFGFYVTSREPWFIKPARLWYDCDSIPCQYPVSNSLLLQYCLQLGFYLQAVPALFIWDVKRKDFYQMLAHHIATICLIVYSIYTNLVRAGAMILVIHDVCDVFMEAAKLLKYLEYEDCATATFGMFVVVWIAMRVVYLPLYLIHSCMVDTIGFLAVPYEIPPEPHYIFLNGLLCLLYCIHLYWTYLILKIVWSVLVLKKEVDDVREEEEDEKKDK